MNKEKKLEFPFPNKKFIKTSELLNIDMSYYMINRFVAKGLLLKINGGTYQNLNYQGDENDFLYVSGYFCEGVVCLMSAAVYHEMSTVRPSKIDVAVNWKANVNIVPDWPPISLYYFGKDRHEVGVSSVEIEGGAFKVYDREKTVCDLLAYRKKYGFEECLSVLKNYLNREDRDINKLIRYAQKLRCYNILSKYLEVLL